MKTESRHKKEKKAISSEDEDYDSCSDNGSYGSVHNGRRRQKQFSVLRSDSDGLRMKISAIRNKNDKPSTEVKSNNNNHADGSSKRQISQPSIKRKLSSSSCCCTRSESDSSVDGKKKEKLKKIRLKRKKDASTTATDSKRTNLSTDTEGENSAVQLAAKSKELKQLKQNVENLQGSSISSSDNELPALVNAAIKCVESGSDTENAASQPPTQQYTSNLLHDFMVKTQMIGGHPPDGDNAQIATATISPGKANPYGDGGTDGTSETPTKRRRGRPKRKIGTQPAALPTPPQSSAICEKIPNGRVVDQNKDVDVPKINVISLEKQMYATERVLYPPRSKKKTATKANYRTKLLLKDDNIDPLWRKIDVNSKFRRPSLSGYKSDGGNTVCSKVLAAKSGYVSDYGTVGHRALSGYKSDASGKSRYSIRSCISRAKSCDFRCGSRIRKLRRKRRMLEKTRQKFGNVNEQDILQLAGLSLGQSNEESSRESLNKPTIIAYGNSKKYGEINRFVRTGEYFGRNKKGTINDFADACQLGENLFARSALSTKSSHKSQSGGHKFLEFPGDFEGLRSKIRSRRSSAVSRCSTMSMCSRYTSRKKKRRRFRLKSQSRMGFVDSKLNTEIEILTSNFPMQCRIVAEKTTAIRDRIAAEKEKTAAASTAAALQKPGSKRNQKKRKPSESADHHMAEKCSSEACLMPKRRHKKAGNGCHDEHKLPLKKRHYLLTPGEKATKQTTMVVEPPAPSHPPPGIFEPSIELEIQINLPKEAIAIVTKSEIDSPKNLLDPAEADKFLLNQPKTEKMVETLLNRTGGNLLLKRKRRKAFNRTGFPASKKKRRKISSASETDSKPIAPVPKFNAKPVTIVEPVIKESPVVLRTSTRETKQVKESKDVKPEAKSAAKDVKEIKETMDKEVKVAKDKKEFKDVKDKKVVKDVKDKKEVTDTKEVKVTKDRDVKVSKDREVKVTRDREVKVTKDKKEMKVATDKREVKVVKDPKEVKVVKDQKEVKVVKDQKEVKVVKDQKEVKVVKDQKEVKVVKDQKEVKVVKDQKEVKVVKDQKEVKVVKDQKEVKVVKDQKEVKVVKDKKESKENSLPKEVKPARAIRGGSKKEAIEVLSVAPPPVPPPIKIIEKPEKQPATTTRSRSKPIETIPSNAKDLLPKTKILNVRLKRTKTIDGKVLDSEIKRISQRAKPMKSEIATITECSLVDDLEQEPLPQNEGTLSTTNDASDSSNGGGGPSTSKVKKVTKFRKSYLPAGLLSSYFKTDRINKKSGGSDKSEKSSESDDTDQPTMPKSILPSPPYCEKFFRRSVYDFKLPHDLWLAHTNSKLVARNTVPSWNYKKIRTNLYGDTRCNPSSDNQICNCKPSTACGDDCLNRMVYTECSPANCPCSDKCLNQKIQKHEVAPGTERFMTANKGWGVQANLPIRKGTYIMEYVGEVVVEREFKERMATLYMNDTHHYCLHLDGGLVIDGHRMGSDARFVNHSCSPNCEMQKWSVNGLFRMALFAMRDIEPGEELTYDYNFSLFNPAEGQPCRCDTPQCRGVIGGKSQRIKPLEIKTVTEPPPPNRHGRPRKRAAKKNSGRIQSKDIVVPQCATVSDRERKIIRLTQCFLMRNLERVRRTKKKTITKIEETPSRPMTPSPLVVQISALKSQRNIKTRGLTQAAHDPEFEKMAKIAVILQSICTELESVTDLSGKSQLSKLIPAKKKKRTAQDKNKLLDFATIRTNIEKGVYKDVEMFDADVTKFFELAAAHFESSSVEVTAVEALRQAYIVSKNKFYSQLAEFVDKTSLLAFRTKQPDNNSRQSEVKSAEDIIRCICGLFKDEGLMIQCSKCFVWQHIECTKADPKAESYLCEKCSRREIDYEIPLNDLTDDGHRYYLSLMRGDLQIRQGDTVYVLRDIPIKDENGKAIPNKKHTYETIGSIEFAECDIFRVEKLWKNADGKRLIYGHHYLRPHETFHEPSRKFYENEVIRVPYFEVVPIELVMARCWVFDRNTYCKGRPVDCHSEEHVYICELRVDKTARFFSRAKQAYPTCLKNYAFRKFKEKLKVYKTYAPHEVDPNFLKSKKRRSEEATVISKKSVCPIIQLVPPPPKTINEKRSRLESILGNLKLRNTPPLVTTLPPVDLSYLLTGRGARHRRATAAVVPNK